MPLDADILHGVGLAVRLGLAGVFAVAATAKLADLERTRDTLRGFAVAERVVAPAAWALPLTELAIAALLVPTATARGAAVGAAGLLALFSIGLVRARDADCNCFGALGGRGGRTALVRNALLGVAAVGLAIAGPGNGVGAIGPAGALAIAAVLLVAALGLASWHLLRQNRRLLERVRELEERDAARVAVAPRVPPVGAPAPRFTVTDAAGDRRTLEELLSPGRPLALVFSDPACGACESLPATLARLQAERAGEVDLALVTRGTPDNGRFAPVLLQQEHELARAYGAGRMPSALLIDPDGRVASPLAVGERAIEHLLATRDLRLEVVN
jgi:AhpC/TSA family